jgi:hypothetical protein
MRTKTLVLTALSSLSALGLMAQTSTNVYSLNAVGYINVTIPPGFSILTDQLIASGGNALTNLIPDSDGSFDFVSIYTWTGTSFNTDTATLGSNPGTSDNWQSGGTIALNPGIGAWIQNPNTTNLTVTFVGTVPQGTNTVALSTGFNLVSSPVPQSGFVSTDLGLTNLNNFDTVYVYTPGTGPTAGFFSGTFFPGSGSGYQSGWSPSEPTVNVGQGFWYQATAPVSWTRVFSVNN